MQAVSVGDCRRGDHAVSDPMSLGAVDIHGAKFAAEVLLGEAISILKSTYINLKSTYTRSSLN